jgi:hypothetical protein
MSTAVHIKSPQVSATQAGFFERNTEQRREIIEGLIREQQLVAFAGPYGVGKSPTLADIAVHVLSGTPWCGRAVEQRPVIHFDLETPGPVYKANVRKIAARLNIPNPRVPEELDVCLEHDSPEEAGTKKLLAALEQKKIEARIDLIAQALASKPDALIIIDPLELLFRVDTGKKMQVLWLYGRLRQLLCQFSHAAMILTFNLRKLDRNWSRPNLLTSPREWLEEVCGTLDILNRCDVRLGMDLRDDEARVINGIRRGEEMQPLLIGPISTDAGLAGFELRPPEGLNLSSVLKPTQHEHWRKLPKQFRFEEVADRIVPRASLSRLLRLTTHLGLIEQRDDGTWVKKAG